ncbi:uncharacterized protein DUF4224 [Paraburkholderia silvatlantica]|uniref:Uncharacterized protein DUF4224 n=1 Tax=Paraburkholderia silvatlantica TaxID=321895 RepID=A0A2V4SY23_9BURK|nr:DUF4224 domain-containing protein [Paraburkholderia silvatlantica]PYE13382.1 uncharacterized protein DUF4224 [Paraburkholderia silvatlantica]
MSERLMSHDDLARVTGKKRYSKQAAWFKEQFGINVVRCGDGSPVMTWATFEALQAKKAGLSSAPLKEERPALRPATLRAVK